MADFASPLYSKINDGVARALFLVAWANAEEEQGRTYPGQDINDVAPETPDYAKLHGAYVIGQTVSANRMPLASLYSQACKADGVDYEQVCAAFREEHEFDSKEERKAEALMKHAGEFGHYIGMMSLGAGPSWFDDHEKFEVNRGMGEPLPFKVPLTEFHLDPIPATTTVRPLMAPAGGQTFQRAR